MCPAEALASESPDSAASDAGAAGEPANEKDAFDMAREEWDGGDQRRTFRAPESPKVTVLITYILGVPKVLYPGRIPSPVAPTAASSAPPRRCKLAAELAG